MIRKGDKLVCIDTNIAYKAPLTVGGQYSATRDEENGRVWVIGDDGAEIGYYIERFRHSTSQFRAGDRLRCVTQEAKGESTGSLTIGNVYIAGTDEIAYGEVNAIRVLNDRGGQCDYPVEMFVLAEPAEDPKPTAAFYCHNPAVRDSHIKHPTLDKAIAEAKRLCENGIDEIEVLQVVSLVKAVTKRVVEEVPV